jgi:hypothetical protein
MGLTNYYISKDPTPEDKTPPAEAETEETSTDNPAPNKSFDELIRALYNSVSFAQRRVETEHMAHVMRTYFDEDGTPKCYRIKLPTNEGGEAETDIPLLTLSPSQHLSISELEMEFNVDIGEFSDEQINGEKVSARIGSENHHKNKASIKLKFKGSGPPEGIARVNDQLIKVLPS